MTRTRPRARGAPDGARARVDPLVVQSIVVSVVCALTLALLTRVPGVFHPDRVGWIHACCVSFVVLGALAGVRRRVGRPLMWGYILQALVLMPLIGSSTRSSGVLVCCALALPSVLVSAATFLTGREVVAVGGLGAVAAALLMASQGAHGWALAALTATVVALGVLPALVLHAFREQLEAALARSDLLSRTDPLTGLLNRTGLAQGVVALAADPATTGSAVGVLVVDVDHFKRVNDVHGHLVGDAVLKRLAATLRAACRAGDLVARTGGEEMCVVTVCASAQDLPALAERVRSSVEGTPAVPRITVSVGAAWAVAHPGQTVPELVERLVGCADSALYEVKAAGRNGVRVSAA